MSKLIDPIEKIDPCDEKPRIEGELPASAEADSAVQFLYELDRTDADGFKREMQKQEAFKNGRVLSYTGDRQTIFGAWTDGNPALDPERREWLRREAESKAIASSPTGSVVGFRVAQKFIRAQAESGFAAMPVKRFNVGNGQPNPNGDVHLTRLEVVPQAPDTLITRLFGFVEVRPFGLDIGLDLPFRLDFIDLFEIVDVLEDGGTKVACKTRIERITSTAAEAFLAFLAIHVPMPFLPQALFLFANRDKLPPTISIGEALAEGFRHVVLVPLDRGAKLLFNFTEVVVDGAAVIARAHIVQHPRQPEIAVSGPRAIVVPRSGANPPKRYSVDWKDFRFDPADAAPIKWMAGADARVVRQSGRTAEFAFDAGNAAPGARLSRTVKVAVGPDLDGFTKEREVPVSVYVQARAVQPPVTDLPEPL